jgi:4-amino-4-deoxy-L-arabinose transferase and related glycosyltransferases of PMT family
MRSLFERIKFGTDKIEILLLFSICFLILFTRIPFFSKYLDGLGINYAFAFEKYDIFQQQPQPPGNVLYVATGKAINFFLNDANFTMLLMTVILSILTAILVYLLAKDIFSRTIAIGSSLLIIFNPIFWFYGEIAEIYVCEAFFAILFAYICYQLVKGDQKFLYLSALILGLSGGFRQDLIVLMFPLWLFCVCNNTKEHQKIIKLFAILIISIMVWFIPTVLLAGGYESYSLFTGSFFAFFFKFTSVFFGSSVKDQLLNDLRLILNFIIAMSLGTIVLLFLIITHRKSIFKMDIFKNKTSIFFVLWIMPAFLFYLLIHLGNSGYTLIYVPAVTIVVGWLFFTLSSDLNKRFKNSISTVFLLLLIFSIFLNTSYFLYSENMEEGLIDSFSTIGNSELDGKINLVFSLCDTNYDLLKSEDTRNMKLIKSILEITNNDPKSTLVIVKYDNVYFPLYAKMASYYLPSYKFYFCSNDTRPYEYKNLEHISYNNKILVSPKIKKIIWMSDDMSFIINLKSKIKVNTVTLDKYSMIYYSDVENQHVNFEVSSIQFTS